VAVVVRNGFSRHTGPAGFSGRACGLFLGSRAADLQAFLGGLQAFSWRLLTQAGPGRP
jgi:hypothetical protein